MRTPYLKGMLFCLFFITLTALVPAQETALHNLKKPVKVKKHTIMQRYEPAMVVSPDDRIELKKARIETVAHREAVIDTLDIADSKKRRLLRELHNTPFTEEFDRAIADLEARRQKELERKLKKEMRKKSREAKGAGPENLVFH